MFDELYTKCQYSEYDTAGEEAMKAEIREFFRRSGVIAYPLILISIITIFMVVMGVPKETIDGFWLTATYLVLVIGTIAVLKKLRRQ